MQSIVTSSDAANVERLLISAVLNSGDLKSAIEVGVSPDMFVAYRTEWEDLVTTTERRRGQVPLTTDFLRRWSGSIALDPTDDVEHFAEQVRLMWASNVLRSQMLDAADLIDAADYDKLRRATEGLQSVLRTVNRTIEPVKSFSLKGNVSAINDEVARRFKEAQANGGSAGVPFGRPTLDQLTGGKIGSMFGVVAARTNVGKSWELLSWALAAAEAGKKVVFFSLEMDSFAVALRLLALEGYRNRAAGGAPVIDPGALAKGQIDRNLGRNFGTWLSDLQSRLPGDIEIIDRRRGSVTTSTVAASCDKHQPDELYVDGIQILKPARRLGAQAADWQAVAEVSSDLFEIAGEGGIPVLASSQINRTQVSNHTPPDLENLARSDAIAQDADLVITMTDYAPNVWRVKLAKSRLGGGKGTIYNMAFEPQLGRIEEITMQEAEQMKALWNMQQMTKGVMP